MKELYLGLSVVAFILILLSITVESSLTGFGKSKQTGFGKSKQTESKYAISSSDLKDGFPERAYGKNNLNRVFLKKYYNNKYYNNFNAKNKFYMSN
jgi:hypothetical protein